MKPVLLKFHGLRSYVEPQSIDFTDRRFIAILGDTGAGKSTILDAICFALYNRCSWTGGTVGDLIAQAGDGTLSVIFTFEQTGRTWTVERGASNTSSAPVNKLTAVDTNTIVATGRDAVNDHILRIIRLKYDTFLRAVVLPQGRFQELLRAGDSDRTKTLKTLLGLDQLSAAREHALTLHHRLVPRLAAYRERRAQFLDDPQAAILDATVRRKAAREDLDRLQQGQRDIAAANKAAGEAQARHTALGTARDRLGNVTPDDIEDRHQRILAAEVDITARRGPLDTQIAEADEALQRRQTELDTAARDGTGVEATATALSTLEHLAEQVPELDVLAQRLKRDTSDVAVKKLLLEHADARVTELFGASEAAALKLGETAMVVGTAEQAVKQAAEALAEHKQATETVSATAERIAEIRVEIARLTTEAQDAAARTKLAEDAVTAAEEREAAAHRLHAAAIAADGTKPGDDCPVCHRELPPDFTAPHDDGAKAATTVLRTARKTAAAAVKEEATAKAKVAAAEQETLTAADRAAGAAASALDAAAQRVRAILGDADPATPTNQLLQHHHQAVDDAKILHDEAQIAAREASDAHNQAKGELPALQAAQKQRERVLAELQADHDAMLVRLNQTARSMRRAFRPEHGLPLDSILEQRGRARQRQIELKAVTDQQEQIRLTLKPMHEAARKLEDEQKTRVTLPAAELRAAIDKVADRVTDLEMVLDVVAVYPARTADVALADEVTWTTGLLEYAAGLSRDSEAAAETARLAVITAEQTADQARRTCQADSDDHLEQLVRAASTAEHNAGQDLGRAEAHEPIATELTRRIEAAEPTVTALSELAALLTDGKFITNAVQQRERELIRSASKTFKAISNGKYGFGPAFRIIDNENGRNRDARTLSGGETFQASLALALTVVELASRTSGRIDSLFLDEGFGSLDAGVLQDALHALAEHSNDGRMVTAISHMRSLAEITENVLVVEKTFAGSRMHWASPDERESIINDDLNRGLLG